MSRFLRRTRKIVNLLKTEASLAESLLTRRAVAWGLPPVLMVEPTDLCNLRCPQCITGTDTLHRPRGMMPFEDFTKIICEAENSLMFLMLFYCGEPFINPELFKMVRFAKDRGIVVLTSTNGHFLESEGQQLEVLRSGLDRLVISLYGATPETYEMYGNRGRFEQVTASVRQLARKRRELGLARPILDLEFVVMRHNEHEIRQAEALGHSLGADMVTFKTAYVMDLHDPVQVAKYIPSDLRYSRYHREAGALHRKADVRQKCQRLWRIATIYWDGTMAGCCCDQDNFAPMGNVLSEGLQAVWQSPRYNSFRERMIGDAPRPAMCDHCTGGLHKFYLVDYDKPQSFFSFRLKQAQIYGAQFLGKYW